MLIIVKSSKNLLLFEILYEHWSHDNDYFGAKFAIPEIKNEEVKNINKIVVCKILLVK